VVEGVVSDLTAVFRRPILFSGPMVKAILDGRKTQTRRVIKPQLEERVSDSGEQGLVWLSERSLRAGRRDWVLEGMVSACPYGIPGVRLWVRETWAVRRLPAGLWVEYQADGHNARLPEPHEHNIRDEGGKVDLTRYVADRWRPSIHMPRWASRITLEITGVRVERVQDISECDAKAEGAEAASDDVLRDTPRGNTYRAGFARLWDSINGPRGYGWDVNPWVWVVEFRRV
jgi:hypothetical protein